VLVALSENNGPSARVPAGSDYMTQTARVPVSWRPRYNGRYAVERMRGSLAITHPGERRYLRTSPASRYTAEALPFHIRNKSAHIYNHKHDIAQSRKCRSL